MATGLDVRYVPLFTLEEVMVDKTTGALLSGGIVNFYRDSSRNTPKNVYQISGNPTAGYTYTNLGSQLILSATGKFVDSNGNSIVPYAFPYDGNATTTTNTIDLYYITVTNSTGTAQFQREAVPNLAEDVTPVDNNQINYVPNGQFLIHNDRCPVPSTETLAYGGTVDTLNIVTVAPGGLTFERSNVSTATDTITFIRPGSINQYVGDISGSPRFAINIVRSVAGGSSEKCHFSVKFPDVNKFAGQEVTFLFNAKLNSGSSLAGVQLYELDYFGTSNSSSGSPTPATTVYTPKGTTQTITTTQTQFAIPFTCNTGDASKNIGSDNNDFVQFALAFPPTSTFNLQMTDFMLLIGSFTGGSGLGNTPFPIQRNGDFILDAMAGLAQTSSNPQNATPVYYPQDGSNLYLPVIMTPKGFTFDYSEIGNIVAESSAINYSSSISTCGNRLLADGAQYKTTDYSPLGIPYSRLQAFFLASGSGNVPQWGTGANFTTAYIMAGANQKLIFTWNKTGNPGAPANGGISPGFSFPLSISGSTDFNFIAFTNGSTLVTSICSTAGVAFTGGTTPSNIYNAGTSGMSAGSGDIRNNASTKYAFNITALDAATLGNGAGTGKYFEVSNTTTRYRFWFKTATESAPAAGGNTLVEIDLDLNMTAADVAKVLANVLSGFQVGQIQCTAASSISTGAWFTFIANSVTYTVWYKKDGSGTAPAGSNLIQVNITTGQTNAQVAAATQLAINSYYFAVPDLRGLFLRGYDSTGKWDIDYLSRFSYANTLTNGAAGTLEIDKFAYHNHPPADTNGVTPGSGFNPVDAGHGGNLYAAGNLGLAITAPFTGGSDTRPVNASVVWAVKY